MALACSRDSVDQIRLNPTTQQNVVTYTVIVKAANPDGALLPGMTANANFIVAEKEARCAADDGAVVQARRLETPACAGQQAARSR